LDVFVVRKLGVPGHEELALGAIASGGVRVLNDEIVASLELSPEAIERVTAAEREELARRERAFRGDVAPPVVAGREVLLVDDGLATGATMAAAVAGLRRLNPRRIVVAAPVASTDAAAAMRRDADDVITLGTPSPFHGVGAWYDDFRQTTDAEVQELLIAARGRQGAEGAA
ncbi:MAG: phosphoribosyltransferase, partial [Gemmatimonadales bacterium]